MAISAFIGRQTLSAAVIVGVLPVLSSPLPAKASLLPPASRAQLIHASDIQPSRAIPYVITPERRAMLNTIRFAEGTWKGGLDVGYRVMFGGGLMPSLARHPNRVTYSSCYASAAAGAYQFMPATWRIAVRALDLVGFGPHAQDQAALYLIQKRGAMNLADGGVLTPQLAAKLAPEWASFPTMRGYSYYGQPVVKYGRLKRFYEANLQRLRQMHPPVALIEEPQVIDQGPEPCNDDSLECMLAKVSEGL